MGSAAWCPSTTWRTARPYRSRTARSSSSAGTGYATSTPRTFPTPGRRGVLFEETTGTLLCGDLFTQLGDPAALVSDDIVGPAGQAEDVFRATCLTPSTGPTIRRLAELAPTTLAVMHGSCYTGDATKSLLALAADYDARLAAA